MNLTVKCPHGTKLSVGKVQPSMLRRYARELLLACPRCHRQSVGFLKDPGA